MKKLNELRNENEILIAQTTSSGIDEQHGARGQARWQKMVLGHFKVLK